MVKLTRFGSALGGTYYSGDQEEGLTNDDIIGRTVVDFAIPLFRTILFSP